MTSKQKMHAAVHAMNHAKLMLQTANGLTADPHGYREGYLQWAEQALLAAAKHVKELREKKVLV